ncbi:MAG: Uma2 family endonuclease [Trueperaceae bacterium]
MSAVAEKLLTAEEFEKLPETEMHRELVRGKVVETMPPGAEHGGLAFRIAMLLSNWLKQNNLKGYLGVESGYDLFRNPDVVRAPDVSYIRAERMQETAIPKGFWNLAPDLAVEVVSPSETAQGVRDKVSDFLAAGTLFVWVIYPQTREVVVHTTDGLARTFTEKDWLKFDLLPGFKCSVAEIFEL